MKKIEERKKILQKWSETFTESYGLVNLFETNGLDEDKIKEFLSNIENIDYINMFISYLNLNCSIHELISLDIINTKNLSLLRLFIKCVCAYALLDHKLNYGRVLQYENLTIKDTADLFDTISDEEPIRRILDLPSYYKAYYRGQSNYSWGLIPSFFRNYNFKTKNDGEIVDIKKMYLKYDEAGLINKYNETIAIKEIKDSKDLDYNFISYMQHSVSYSPLIDITSKFEIGVQFALGNKADINSYYGDDSALFAIYNSSIDISRDISTDDILQNHFKVTILKGKIRPGTIMIVDNSIGLPESLDFTTIKQIIKHLTPKYAILDNVKNDRMKYQHGKFILFYDYVLVNQQIMFALNKDFKAAKLKISTSKKNKIYKKVNDKYPQYNMDYLMNPYDYFNK